MPELAISMGQFVVGILQRFLWLLPAFLLDPFDLYERYLYPKFGWDVTMPDWYFPAALAGLVFWAAMLTFHEQRVKALHAIRFDIRDWATDLPSYNRSRPKQPFVTGEVVLNGQLINQDSGQATLETLTMRLSKYSWMRWWIVGQADPLVVQSGLARRDLLYETIIVGPRSKSRDVTKLTGYFHFPEDCDPAGRYKVDVIATSVQFKRPSLSSSEVSFKELIAPSLASRQRAIERGMLRPDDETAGDD